MIKHLIRKRVACILLAAMMFLTLSAGNVMTAKGVVNNARSGSVAKNITMKNKKWVTGQGGIYEDLDKDGYLDFISYGTSYYKIKIPSQGYIVVDVKTSSLPRSEEYEIFYDEPNDARTNISLLNSKKKELGAGGITIYEKSRAFTAGVKKGTYYISVEGDQKYKLRYSFTSVPKVSKAGKSLKNAVSLKQGKTVKNLLMDGRNDLYYKIKLKKKSKVILSFQAKVKGEGFLDEMSVQLLVKKGKQYREVNEKGKLISKNQSYWWEIDGKEKLTFHLPKGTYYIRTSTIGWGGYYTMKWQ